MGVGHAQMKLKNQETQAGKVKVLATANSNAGKPELSIGGKKVK